MAKMKDVLWVPKRWGGEKIIVNNDKYCGKILYFVKNKKCSLHYHKNKHETFYVQRGRVAVYYSDDLSKIQSLLETDINHLYGFLEHITLNEGDAFCVPPGRIHQMFAREDTELFEFSTYSEDSDSYRIQKGD